MIADVASINNNDVSSTWTPWPFTTTQTNAFTTTDNDDVVSFPDNGLSAWDNDFVTAQHGSEG